MCKTKYLISIPNCSIQTIDIGDKEDTEEEDNAMDQIELRRDHLDPPHTGTTVASKSFNGEVSLDTRLNGIGAIFLMGVVHRHVHSQIVTGIGTREIEKELVRRVKACL